MRRDIVFLVNGVPDGLLVRDVHYFSAPVAAELAKEIQKLGADVSYWLRKGGKRFHAFGFRNDVADETEAIMDAHEKLSGIVDGYSFLAQDSTPEIWPIVQIREEDQLHASIKFLELKVQIRMNSKDGVAEKSWDERNERLLKHFLEFFDVVATDDVKFDNELCNQIGLSAKMFRCGSSARAHGVDFLCKFTALEGLVCGPVKHGHGKLLQQRLSELFRHRKGIGKEVEDLWSKRCEASHQGKAFSERFAVLIDPLEKLTLGTIVFAINHVKFAKTVDELWSRYAAKYELPAEVTIERPTEISRYQATRFIVDPNMQFNNVGPVMDRIFRDSAPVK